MGKDVGGRIMKGCGNMGLAEVGVWVVDKRVAIAGFDEDRFLDARVPATLQIRELVSHHEGPTEVDPMVAMRIE